MSVRSILLSSIAVSLLVPIVPAVAQEKRDIIVTARKREESLLKVPINETVVTREQIERYATNDLQDLANQVPSFIIGSQFHGVLAAIRGVGTSTTNPGVDQSVALNIDGLQTSQGFSYNSAFFDVGQVEVLKGPQALFFGKNAPAGVIAIRSADPTDEFELVTRMGVEFKSNSKQPELIASGPVGNGLKMRLAAQYTDRDSYFRNKPTVAGAGGRLPTDDDLEHVKDLLLRGTVLFEPSPQYTARLKLNYERTRQDGNNFGSQGKACPEGTNSTVPGFQFIDPADQCHIGRTYYFVWDDPAAFPGIRNGGTPFDDRDRYYGTLEQNLEVLDGLTATALTGYFDLHRDSLLSPLGIISAIASDHTWTQRSFTQEVRLTSDFKDSPLNFMVGGFYEHERMQQRNRTRANVLLPLLATFTRPPYNGFFSSARNTVRVSTVSAFGQLIWNVMPTLELAGGARWTSVKTKISEITYLDVPSAGLLAGDRVPLAKPRLKSNDFSPEVTLTYRPTDDLTMFVGYREGFKAGGYNIATYNAPNTDPSFGPESVRGVEGGIKARFLDRSLSVNLGAYWYKYKNLQVSATQLLPQGGFISSTLNAASAKVRGIELDAEYTPPSAPGLSLHGAINYSRARYEKFTNALCENGQTIAEGCNLNLNTVTGRYTAQDLSGEPLLRAPDWTGVAGFNYELPVGQAMTLSFGANARYSGKYQTALINFPIYIQKSYWIADANISLKGENDAWELALIGKNIGDKIITPTCYNTNAQNGGILGGQLSGSANGGPAGHDEAFCFPNPGREIWLRLTVRLSDFLGN